MDAHTLLTAGHLLGVAFGLGGALILDAALLRTLRGASVDSGTVALSRHLSFFVKLGLALLWVTGIGFLVTADGGPAAVFANPKVAAKLAIVIALTLNAVAIEWVALPLVVRNLGRPLLADVSPAGRIGLVVAGAVSAASWVVPFVLGIAKGWNFVVPAADIFAGWLALIFLGTLSGLALTRNGKPPRTTRRVPRVDVVVAPGRRLSAPSA